MFLSVEAGALLRVEKLLEDPVGRVHRLVNVLLGKKILLKTQKRRKKDGKRNKETFKDRKKREMLASSTELINSLKTRLAEFTVWLTYSLGRKYY